MRKLYWGLAIMIVGFIALQIYLHVDMKNFRNEIAGSPKVETIETTDIVFNDEKPKDNPIQPIDVEEVDITNVIQKNSQQHENVENVTVKNYLEGLDDINLFESIIIPSDTQLAKYTDEDIIVYVGKLHQAYLKENALGEKYTKRILAIFDKQEEILRDGNPGLSEVFELDKQIQKLMNMKKDLSEQFKKLSQESKRIEQRPARLHR